MHWLVYLRLIYLTAGTLVAFFWLVVILGHRRQRNFERIFFFLCLELVCFFGCSLLELNAELYYGTIAPGLIRFCWTFVCLGLWFLPSLVAHLHVEYASVRGLIGKRIEKTAWLVGSYAPPILLLPRLWAALQERGLSGFERPTYSLGVGFQMWLVAAMGVAVYWQWRFWRVAPDKEQRRFHVSIGIFEVGVLALFATEIAMQRIGGAGPGGVISALVAIAALVPFGILIGNVQQFHFLQIGRQRNLIYAVFLTFVALLYLSLVRRATFWLEPILPPEATAALLLFLPVVFFEPLQRTMRRMLQQTAQKELDRAHKLIGPINEAARLGDLEKLTAFCDRWIAAELQLAEARLTVSAGAGSAPQLLAGGAHLSEETLEVRRGAELLGTLRVKSHGAMISGETFAALELVCEQLPAALDLCRSIDEKLQLERELAERERLALVGQMAASISHNLKNPLGSMKTILQLQLESPELPATMRQETQMVLDEIGRLSAKLNQLLQFSRPGLRASGAARCDLVRVAQQVAEVFRHEAEQKGATLEWPLAKENCWVAATAEGASDIISNVMINAIEAVDRGGHVRMRIVPNGASCDLEIEDDGPGIAAGTQERMLQPFFTTKPRGTGLGLAIVQRRLEEISGKLEAESPVESGRGTRFRLTFPLVAAAGLGNEIAG